MNNIKTNKGFTLIELLIVIGIIAILAAAVIITVTPGERLQDAREATRRANVSAIGTAVQLKVVDMPSTVGNIVTHCGTATGSGGAGCTTGTGYVEFCDACAAYVGLPAGPTDPISGFYRIAVNATNSDRIDVWTAQTSTCCGSSNKQTY